MKIGTKDGAGELEYERIRIRNVEHIPDVEKKALQIVGEMAEPLHDDLQSVYDWWVDLPRIVALPSIESIDFLEMHERIETLTLVDVVDGGKDFRIRFLGQNYFFERPMRKPGELLSQSPPSPYRDRIELCLRSTIAARKPTLLGPIASVRPGREYQTIEVMTLPFTKTGEEIARVLSVMRAGNGPRR